MSTKKKPGKKDEQKGESVDVALGRACVRADLALMLFDELLGKVFNADVRNQILKDAVDRVNEQYDDEVVSFKEIVDE